ncbi:ribonuclease G [Catenovulum sp. 2E275]|uniref:ribonuclease G n=1 Tax=Catenovulum sp. 2E275 TaxID=2980497 RepID=UPI0021CF114C|nr:ribonuclease G [Catenovulum sp. 2E275]MCU4676580.1 ribonuclease G [Catenovulum sp. 2E275]
MSAELLINITPTETRVAVVENGSLQEVHIERQAKRGLVGNIYSGKVSRVLPGMQAAFIDIGLDKAAFLHASDISVHDEIKDEQAIDKAQLPVRDIRDLVKEGQDIVVQVVKDPLGTKGARLTTDITIPSRYLVFMPGSEHVGVSQRVESEVERDRLKEVVGQFSDDKGSFIVRTAAEGVEAEELEQDAIFLRRVWNKILKRKQRSGKIRCLYEDLTLAFRILRDFVGSKVERIRVDSKLAFDQLHEFVTEFVPNLKSVIEYYPGERPIFDLFDVENEIQRALERKVQLKSGGYLIIDQTEAMTTIDINTGAFVGHRNLEDTIFNTNIEATQAIARQLRLRNLGGIIIIDFIDMMNDDHKRRVLHGLEQALSYDRTKSNIHGFSALGLVEMTRKRTRESLEHILCDSCHICQGRGSLKTVETICYEILREVVRVNRAYDADRFVVYASGAVCDYLLSEESHALGELEVFIGKQIKVQAEPLYGPEQFDVVMI